MQHTGNLQLTFDMQMAMTRDLGCPITVILENWGSGKTVAQMVDGDNIVGGKPHRRKKRCAPLTPLQSVLNHAHINLVIISYLPLKIYRLKAVYNVYLTFTVWFAQRFHWLSDSYPRVRGALRKTQLTMLFCLEDMSRNNWNLLALTYILCIYWNLLSVRQS